MGINSWLNSLRPDDTIWCLGSWLPWFKFWQLAWQRQAITWSNFFFQLDLNKYISMKFYSKFKTYHQRKYIWICLQNGSHFVRVSMYTKWRDNSGYGLSQWEMMLQCNIISHWLSPFPECSLKYREAWHVKKYFPNTGSMSVRQDLDKVVNNSYLFNANLNLYQPGKRNNYLGPCDIEQGPHVVK